MLYFMTNIEVRVREMLAKSEDAQSGAGIVEYLLLVLFIALALILSLAFFSGRLGNAFSKAGNSIPN